MRRLRKPSGTGQLYSEHNSEIAVIRQRDILRVPETPTLRLTGLRRKFTPGRHILDVVRGQDRCEVRSATIRDKINERILAHNPKMSFP